MDYLSSLCDPLPLTSSESVTSRRTPYYGQDIDLTQPDQIRLLILHPGIHNSPLNVTSCIVHLSAKPTYTALS